MFLKRVDVVFQEVRNEISLCLTFSGCPIRCKGCHSPELWTHKNSNEVHVDDIVSIIKKYDTLITCVVFMGGDWEQDCLKTMKTVKRLFPNLKLCLYSGYNEIDPEYYDILDYVKLGPYIEELGGLESKTTNQIFKEITRAKAQ